MATITQIKRIAKSLETAPLSQALNYLSASNDKDLYLFFKVFEEPILKRQCFLSCNDKTIARAIWKQNEEFFK